MRRSTAGEGDVSSLKLAPWQINGSEAFNSVALKQPSAKGFTSFGKLSADLSPTARAFLDRCVTEHGMDGAQVVEAAKTASLISEDIAKELEPLTKLAALPGFKTVGSLLARWGKGLLGFGGKAAPKAMGPVSKAMKPVSKAVKPILPKVTPVSSSLPATAAKAVPPGFLSKVKRMDAKAVTTPGRTGRPADCRLQ